MACKRVKCACKHKLLRRQICINTLIFQDEITKVENLYFENIKIKGAYPFLDWRDMYYYTLYVYGLDGEENYFNNIRFKNLELYGRENGDIQTVKIKNVKNLSLENVCYVDNTQNS